MNYKLLNEMIDYIENNLTSEIDYKKLGKIVGENEFILQRIFTFLTGISLYEYIKKRRLSKAYEDLVATNDLIINIAYKYNYNSAVSFDRAFKKEFGITPKKCRENNTKSVLFPRLNFSKIDGFKEVNYEVVKLSKKTLYCYVVSADTRLDLQYKIRELYKKIKKDDTYKIMNDNGMYAISIKEKDKLLYYLGCSKQLPNAVKKTVPSGEYLKFDLESRYQKDIVKVSKNIHDTYIPSLNYITNKNYDIEYYEGDTCYRLIPIK